MAISEPNKAEIIAAGIPEKIANETVLSGLKEIAAYMRISISTVRRSIKRYGLPAGSAGMGGKYITTKFNIDKWILTTHLQSVIKHNWDRIPINSQAKPARKNAKHTFTYTDKNIALIISVTKRLEDHG